MESAAFIELFEDITGRTLEGHEAETCLVDLGLDSLELVAIAMAMEDVLGCEVTLDDLAGLETVGDAIAMCGR